MLTADARKLRIRKFFKKTGKFFKNRVGGFFRSAVGDAKTFAAKARTLGQAAGKWVKEKGPAIGKKIGKFAKNAAYKVGEGVTKAANTVKDALAGCLRFQTSHAKVIFSRKRSCLSRSCIAACLVQTNFLVSAS